MEKFRFELEPLLKARRLAEQSHQRVVSGLERERLHVENALRMQQQRISEGKASLRAGLIGAVNVEGARLHAVATIQLMRDAQRMALELAGLHRRLEAARTELIESSRQRRAIELLRERRFEQWKLDQDRRETEAMDELAVIAAARQDDRHFHLTGVAESG